MPDGLVLDLCFQRVPEPVAPDPRLHLDVGGGAGRREVVQRALDLGARHLDIGQRDVPWVVLADPEGNPFCVMEERPEYDPSGPIAALPLDSADPAAGRCVLGRAVRVAAGLLGDARRAAAPLGARGAAGAVPEPGPRTRAPRTGCTSTSGSRSGDDADAAWPAVVELGGRELDPELG